MAYMVVVSTATPHRVPLMISAGVYSAIWKELSLRILSYEFFVIAPKKFHDSYTTTFFLVAFNIVSMEGKLC